LRALASFYRGIIYFERKEYANAMACFESASTHVIDALDQVTVYNNICTCAMHLGDLPRAERVFSEIEKLSGQLKGDHSLRCQLMASSYGGAIQQARGEYDRAIELFRQALKLALRSGDGTAIANQLGNLGTAYARAGNGEKGFQLLNACMAYSERVGYWAGIRFAYWHIHRMLLESGNSSEARKFMETYSARYPELKNLQ
jgi:tetratricopeptide (TPR) repeat protein